MRANPNVARRVSYKEMNSRYPTSDVEHQRNRHYGDPVGLAAELVWSTGTVKGWLAAGNDEAADAINRILQQKAPDLKPQRGNGRRSLSRCGSPVRPGNNDERRVG